MSNLEIRNAIKSLIKAMGLSERDAASHIYDEIDYDLDDEDSRRRFYDRFRKKLNRDTTNVDELLNFQNILKKKRAYSGLDQIIPTYVANASLTFEERKLMLDVSRTVSEMVKNGS